MSQDDGAPDTLAAVPMPSSAAIEMASRLGEAGDVAIAGRAPVAPGRVAVLPAAAVPLEEDPRVELSDVVRSVWQVTASAVPWLHLAAPRAVPGRPGPGGEALPEVGFRVEDANGEPGASTAPRDASAAGGTLPPLSEELKRVLRELAANPLAWMTAFLVLIVGMTITAVRGRD